MLVSQASSASSFVIGTYYAFTTGCPLMADFTFKVWDTTNNVEFASIKTASFVKSTLTLNVDSYPSEAGTYELKLKLIY